MPELPEAKKQRFIIEYALPEYDAAVLTTSHPLADFFEETARNSKNPKAASNWIMGDLLRDLKEFNIGIEASPITPQALSELIGCISSKEISGKMGKDIFEIMFRERKPPKQVIQEKGLKQIIDPDEITKIIHTIISSNPKIYEQYKEDLGDNDPVTIQHYKKQQYWADAIQEQKE